MQCLECSFSASVNNHGPNPALASAETNHSSLSTTTRMFLVALSRSTAPSDSLFRLNRTSSSARPWRTMCSTQPSLTGQYSSDNFLRCFKRLQASSTTESLQISSSQPYISVSSSGHFRNRAFSMSSETMDCRLISKKRTFLNTLAVATPSFGEQQIKTMLSSWGDRLRYLQNPDTSTSRRCSSLMRGLPIL
uniref:(northern house mosquito) hypothetical protein n=1 Tax=Culex pipiens TaxID=7175 RepID=A0A8D8GXM3_CULPI